MKLPDTICMLPWVSIETSPIGTARPCCLAMHEITDKDNKKFNLRESTLEDVYRSEYMQNLRKEFLDGKRPKTCKRCWEEESAGRVSKRMNSRTRLKAYYDSIDWQNTNPDQLWFIDLKLGNICNLKCRICGSWSSSKWAKEEIDYVPGINRKDHLAHKFLMAGAWPRETEIFWENLKTLLPSIKYFEFTGGEPFLIEQHFELLRFAVEQGHSQHIEIHYNTNGTVFPEQHELWNKFKHVEIAFSIDNIGSRFEYERYGADWNQVLSNLDKFTALRSTRLSTQLCCTVNTQNVYYMPEICEWLDTRIFDHVYFNMLHDPWQMNIGRMTAQAKQLVIDRLSSYKFTSTFSKEIKGIIQFILNGAGSDGVEFCRKIKQTDDYRGQSFLITHTEIAEAMGYGKT